MRGFQPLKLPDQGLIPGPDRLLGPDNRVAFFIQFDNRNDAGWYLLRKVEQRHLLSRFLGHGRAAHLNG